MPRKARVWPPGKSEMARRIREFDWSATPLGPASAWPLSLRAAVDVCLGSQFPSAVLWGPDLTLLHNDAHIPILGTRHPGALGGPAPAVLADSWPVLGGRVSKILEKGVGISVPDLVVTFDRGEEPRAAHLAVSLGPLHDETGRTTGVMITAIETTARIRAEAALRESEKRTRAEQALRESQERQTFLLHVSDVLRPLTDPAEVKQAVAHLLGERIGASRVAYGEVQNGTFIITRDYADPQTSTLAGRYRLGELGSKHISALRSGDTVVVDDAATSDRLSISERASHAAIGIGALISAPIIKEGELAAVLLVHHRKPRAWTANETALVEETAERAWDAVQRARAEHALRLSEERMRLVFDNLPVQVGFYDRDLRYAYVNRAGGRFFGMPHQTMLGKHLRDWLQPHVFARLEPFFAAALRGERVQFEDREPDKFGPGLDGWTEETYIPYLGVDGEVEGFFALVIDITERKRAEAILRASEERQAFLLKLSDALRPLADPIAIQGAACRLLGEHLGVDRAYYVEVDEAAGIATVERDWVRGNGPSLAGAHRVADFAWSVAILRRGECHVIPDTQTSPLVPPAERPASAALQITGCAGAPLIKSGQLVGALCVTTAQSRAWADAEVELLREVGERVWVSIERARAEEALHDREAKYRTLFETMGQGYVLAELVRDETGEAVDILLLELNPAYERLMGVRAEEARGRRVRELFPDVDRWWVEHFDRVVRGLRPERLEHQYNDRGGWFEAWVYPRGQDRFVALFEEITARKQAEAALRESEDRQRFLLALSDALRACPDGESIKERTVAMLGKHLRLDRCYVSEVFEREGYSTVGPEHVRPGLPSMAGVYRLADYPETMRQLMTQSMVVDDADADTRFSDAEKAMLALVPQRALLVTPLRKGSREVVWALAGAMGTPRRWTAGERLLLEEVAERTWAAVERTRAEASLRESEERHRRMLNIGPVGVLVFGPDGALIHANDAFLTMTGYARDDVASGRLHWQTMTPPEFMAETERQMTLLGDTGRIGPYEKEYFRVDGSRSWMLFAGASMGDGTTVEYAIDINDRKRAEAALRTSEERLRAIVEQATDYAIFTADPEGVIDGWLAGAEAVFGWTADEAVGQPFEITFTPEDRAAGEPERELARAEQTGSSPNVRWHMRKNGNRVFIEGVARARRGPDGEFQGVLKIGRDATDRRRAEEALRASEASLQVRVTEATKELRALSRRLLSVQEEERRGLARELHDEIGQMLTGLGFQLGAGGTAADAARLDEARRIVAQLTEQVRQLSMDLRPAALDSYGLLPALQSHVERYERQTGVRIDFRHEGVNRRFPPPVEIAAYRIVQEALTNVARHASVTEAEVRLYADQAVLIASVCDAGNGFAGPISGGSGLGGMRERAELVGGTLTIDAEPGDGVAVTAELPIEPPNPRKEPR